MPTTVYDHTVLVIDGVMAAFRCPLKQAIGFEKYLKKRFYIQKALICRPNRMRFLFGIKTIKGKDH